MAWAPRSGVGAQLGFGVETRPGTFAAPTTFVPLTNESIRRTPEYIRTRGLRAGQIAQDDALHVQTTVSVAGSLAFDFLCKGMLPILDMLNGETAAARTPAGATLAREWEFPLGISGPDGKGRSIQIGKPDVSGVVHPYSSRGCKVADLTLACERGGVVTASVSIDGIEQDLSEPLATATFPVGAIPFNFTRGSLLFDGALLTDVVQSASVTITIPLQTDRHGLGLGAAKAEQVTNDHVGVTVRPVVEFSNLDQENAFRSARRRSVELQFDGPEIEAGHDFFFGIEVPKVVTTDAGPVVEGPQILTQALQLEGVTDGTRPLALLTYITTDTRI